MPNLITRGCWQSMSIWGYHIVLDFTIPRVFRTICKKGVYDGPLPQIYPNIFKRGTNRMFWTIRIYIYIFILCPDSLEFAITVRWRNWIGRTKLIHLYIYTRECLYFILDFKFIWYQHRKIIYYCIFTVLPFLHPKARQGLFLLEANKS